MKFFVFILSILSISLHAETLIEFSCNDYKYKSIRKNVYPLDISLGDNDKNILKIKKQNGLISDYYIDFKCDGKTLFSENTNEISDVHYKDKNYFLNIQNIKNK